jgi:hypothetical protein
MIPSSLNSLLEKKLCTKEDSEKAPENLGMKGAI